MSFMQGVLGLDEEGWLDSVTAVVPLSIVVLLTLLFVAYNPWGWEEPLLIAIVFGLHLVPIVALAPVVYLLIRVVVESSRGESETATRIRDWFAVDDQG